MTTNWAGNYRYAARRVHRPESLDELCELVRRLPRLRVVGTRHSFTGIGDSEELVALDGVPGAVEVDRAAATVTVPAASTYAQLADALRGKRLALRNLASLPHISVGGAIATGTHGSGDRNGNLATHVAALELVGSDGELREIRRGDADFDGAVVGLGGLGAVVRVALDVEPAYEVRQRVFEGLGWDALLERFDGLAGAAASVSVFTRWHPETVEQLWLKTRVDEAEPPLDDALAAAEATAHRHPIEGADPRNCTPQLGQPGLWCDRLPHFRSGFLPSSGAEIQSEYFVARDRLADAVAALLRVGDGLRPLLQVSELRTIAGDGLWLSPHHERDSVGIHFTWMRDQDAVERALATVEAALGPFAPRPHWGKLFLADASSIAPLYPRLADFADLAARLDPRGAFRNEWLERRVLGCG